MSEPADRDPRLRPYRAASWGLYLFVSVGFSLLVIYSVVSSTLRMTPPTEAASPVAITVAQCAAGGRALFDELETARKAHAAGDAVAADRRFLDFRIDWLTRKRRLEAQCALGSSDRASLREALDTLEHLMDLYTTNSVQFSTAIGPDVDQLRAQLERLNPSPR